MERTDILIGCNIFAKQKRRINTFCAKSCNVICLKCLDYTVLRSKQELEHCKLIFPKCIPISRMLRYLRKRKCVTSPGSLKLNEYRGIFSRAANCPLLLLTLKLVNSAAHNLSGACVLQGVGCTNNEADTVLGKRRRVRLS